MSLSTRQRRRATGAPHYNRPMQTVETLSDLWEARRRLGPCALVPTMGNLHAGHLGLVARAREAGMPVVVSIFVNRLQFGPADDFERYPRTLRADCEQLRGAGCDLVFAPPERELYPEPQRFQVLPDPALADLLEGRSRPGFFVGVCTVVMKLFSCVQPRLAVFGKKDYQQWLIVRRMVEQFALPLEIVAAETTRTRDGLALSSRNAYLDPKQQVQAAELSGTLNELVQGYRQEPGAMADLEARAAARLAAGGWEPDYLTVRRRADLQPAVAGDAAVPGRLVALGAARLGQTRLIDNLEF
jgi:pantoate--beta-alanine ligase